MNALYECNAYACYDKCEKNLDNCSSGGVFGILASHVIRMGGYVAGASFWNDFSVHHEIIHNEKDLARLKTSKYVQSNMEDVYKEVEDLLKQGKFVLFSGTPCQAGGLRSFLQKDYDTLYVVDVICHGVPSPMVFRNHLTQLQEQNGKLKSMSFRDKGEGWRWYQMKYCFEDGETAVPLAKDDYFKGFNSNWFLRESCYQCEFRFMNSNSDLTIGDYWNIQSEHPDMWNQNRGVSAVIVKSSRGQQLFDECKGKMCCVTSTVEQITRFNTRIIIPCSYTNIRRHFFDLYVKNNYILSETYKAFPTIQIGIIGGYSSRMVVHQMKNIDHVQILFQISNSSVIGFMGKADKKLQMLCFDSEGDYRKQALEADVKKKWLCDMNISLERCSYIMVDFLEERFDLYERDGCYITKSEALEAFGFDFSKWKKIENEEERRKLWEESCLVFLKKLLEIVPPNRIVLHRIFLNEFYGTEKGIQVFDSIIEIKHINSRLKECYDFFEKNCPDCIVVENKQMEYFYTNRDFPYGCQPQYHNQGYYYDSAKKIAAKLGILRGDREDLLRCTGCGACRQICPTQAVVMQEQRDGFLYPIVLKEKCISCDRCVQVCPLNLDHR